MDDETRDALRIQKGRLDYAVLQLGREAGFEPNNRRLQRGYITVVEVRDEMERLLLNG